MTTLRHNNTPACSLTKQDDYWLGQFTLMASPCQLLIEQGSPAAAQHLLALAYAEGKRIELKYSRFRDDNIIAAINQLNGNDMTTAALRTVPVDEETARLLDFAQLCFQLSDGLFDISAGKLAHLWHFKGQTRPPNDADIQALLADIGWQQVRWQAPCLTLPLGMQLDLGGIGKEYAVDSVATLLQQHSQQAFLVNFGGDMYANKARRNGRAWQVAIEDPQRLGSGERMIALTAGGVASSGDSQRFFEYEGRRYGHILNPQTGYPIQGGPAQVTVLADNCLQAGMLATLALLHGDDADNFLQAQDCHYWLSRR